MALPKYRGQVVGARDYNVLIGAEVNGRNCSLSAGVIDPSVIHFTREARFTSDGAGERIDNLQRRPRSITVSSRIGEDRDHRVAGVVVIKRRLGVVRQIERRVNEDRTSEPGAAAIPSRRITQMETLFFEPVTPWASVSRC